MPRYAKWSKETKLQKNNKTFWEQVIGLFPYTSHSFEELGT
jgi:hypothetical protein